jgi:hypothetical protein
MLFYLLFVIVATNAVIFTTFKPDYTVVLKGTPLLSACCYNEEPANFTPINDYTMVNSLCGVKKFAMISNGGHFCTSSDKLIIQNLPSTIYVVEEIKLDIGIVGKPHTFKCHTGKSNDKLDYSWLNSDGSLVETPHNSTLDVLLPIPINIYICKMSVKGAGEIGTLKLSKQFKPVRVRFEFSITLPENSTAAWIIEGGRALCTTSPKCIRLISYRHIATAKLEITHNGKVVEIPLV